MVIGIINPLPYMKLSKLVVILLVVTTMFKSYSQSKDLNLEANFTAIIVKNMERSIDWYIKVFNFTIINQTTVEERGLKQANLKRNDLRLELIEMSSSIDPSENGTKRVLVQGIFKIGFSVSDFEAWKNHLLELNLINDKDVVTDPVTNKQMLLVKDPDGNRIQLFEN